MNTDSIKTIIGRKYRNIPLDSRRLVAERVSCCINRAESDGQFFSFEDLDDLIQCYIRAHIRHTKTGYDHMLKSGVPKSVCRSRIK